MTKTSATAIFSSTAMLPNVATGSSSAEEPQKDAASVSVIADAASSPPGKNLPGGADPDHLKTDCAFGAI